MPTGGDGAGGATTRVRAGTATGSGGNREAAGAGQDLLGGAGWSNWHASYWQPRALPAHPSARAQHPHPSWSRRPRPAAKCAKCAVPFTPPAVQLYGCPSWHVVHHIVRAPCWAERPGLHNPRMHEHAHNFAYRMRAHSHARARTHVGTHTGSHLPGARLGGRAGTETTSGAVPRPLSPPSPAPRPARHRGKALARTPVTGGSSTSWSPAAAWQASTPRSALAGRCWA